MANPYAEFVGEDAPPDNPYASFVAPDNPYSHMVDDSPSTPETDKALEIVGRPESLVKQTPFLTARKPAPISTTPRVGPDPNDPQAIGPWSTSLTSVGIERPFPDKGENIAEQTLNAVMNFPVDAANFGLSPAGAVTAGAIPVLKPALQRLVALGFTADQIKNAIQAPSWQESLGSLLGAATTSIGVIKAPSEFVRKPVVGEPEPIKTSPGITVDAGNAIVEPALTKEVTTNAEGIRENAGQVPVQGDVQETGASQGSQNLERQAQGKTISGEKPVAEPVPVGEQTPVESGLQPEAEPIGIEAAIAEIQRRNAPAERNPESTVPLPTEEKGKPTGISQRMYDERAVQEPIKPGEGISAEEQVKRGRFLVESGADPDVILQQMKETGHLSGDAISILRAKHEELSRVTNRAEDELAKSPNDPQTRANYDQAWQAEKAWAQEIKPFQTEWHKVGQAMQGEVDVDTGSFTGLRRAIVDSRGTDLKPTEVRQVRDMADKVKKADQSLTESKLKYDEAIKRNSKGQARTAEQLREHFAERIRKLTPC